MNRSRLELKVGLFVLVGLLLLALLAIQFSKGLTFRPTYKLLLKANTAGTLKAHSFVLMSGVPIGSISEIRLSPDGKTLSIHLTIGREYEIHQDARFVIEQSGFLGDQYVS